MSITIPTFSASIHTRGITSNSSSAATTSRILRELGSNNTVLDTVAMGQMGLQPSFRAFDATSVTPADLGMVSKNLYALGFIDKTTANLLVTAGTTLDNLGNQTQPNVKMNALDYFAARIDSLRSANINGNEYAFHVIPDYIKAVYVLQNLSDFAKTTQSQSASQAASSQNAGSATSSSLGISIRI
jgi:hypothetical protein